MAEYSHYEMPTLGDMDVHEAKPEKSQRISIINLLPSDIFKNQLCTLSKSPSLLCNFYLVMLSYRICG